jgi:hypothetical protein
MPMLPTPSVPMLPTPEDSMLPTPDELSPAMPDPMLPTPEGDPVLDPNPDPFEVGALPCRGGLVRCAADRSVDRAAVPSPGTPWMMTIERGTRLLKKAPWQFEGPADCVTLPACPADADATDDCC